MLCLSKKTLPALLITISALYLVHFLNSIRTNTRNHTLDNRIRAFSPPSLPDTGPTPFRKWPKLSIHQSWKTHTLPKRFQQWSQSWRTCFPDWNYTLWSNEENRKLIENQVPWFLKTYDDLPSNITRADAVRYVYLFLFGGIYADLDAECLRPFPHLLEGHDLVFGAMEGQFASHIEEGYTQNSLMYSVPRHPFWLEVLHGIISTEKKNAGPEAITGPIQLVGRINEYRKRFPNSVKIYPPKYFNPFSWLKKKETTIEACKSHNTMTDQDMAACRAFHNESYVLQYHSHSWGGNVNMA